jgi:CRP-like cAMP-binding protein
MFRGWPRSKLEKMCHLVRRKVYKPGEVIVRQDDRTDDVYFVIEGRCEVGPYIYIIYVCLYIDI